MWYELAFFIQEDGILHSDRRGNLLEIVKYRRVYGHGFIGVHIYVVTCRFLATAPMPQVQLSIVSYSFDH
jgi:hypothetical protein